jgi:hypothetical protein
LKKESTNNRERKLVPEQHLEASARKRANKVAEEISK